MSLITGFMSNIIKYSDSKQSTVVPDVKILHSNFMLHPNSWHIAGRNAPFWYLYWNGTPGASLEVSGRTIELGPDYIVLIPPFTTFTTHSNSSFQHFFLHFTADSPFNQVKRNEIILSPPPGIKQRQVWPANPVMRALRLYALLYEVLLKLPESCFSPNENAVIDWRITKALGIIARNNYHCTNSIIARSLGMSSSNFLRLFKQELGLSPQRYQLNQRLEKSREMLLHQNIPITQIAQAAGFADRYHFSKAFKAIFKISPAAFRADFLHSGATIQK